MVDGCDLPKSSIRGSTDTDHVVRRAGQQAQSETDAKFVGNLDLALSVKTAPALGI